MKKDFAPELLLGIPGHRSRQRSLLFTEWLSPQAMPNRSRPCPRSRRDVAGAPLFIAIFCRRASAWLPPLTILWTWCESDVIALTPKIVKDGTPDQRAFLRASFPRGATLRVDWTPRAPEGYELLPTMQKMAPPPNALFCDRPAD